MKTYSSDDIELLLPSYVPIAKRILERLSARGFDPVVRDTLRTFKEAEGFAKGGSGTSLSMHCYGAAMDVICAVHGWECKAAGCPFFEEYGECCELEGMVWGGRWTRGGKGPDKPHNQCVTVSDQKALRRLKTVEERDKFVRERLCRKR